MNAGNSVVVIELDRSVSLALHRHWDAEQEKESDKTDNYFLHLLLKFNRIEDILLIHEFLHVNWVALFVLYFYVLDV